MDMWWIAQKIFFVGNFIKFIISSWLSATKGSWNCWDLVSLVLMANPMNGGVVLRKARIIEKKQSPLIIICFDCCASVMFICSWDLCRT